MAAYLFILHQEAKDAAGKVSPAGKISILFAGDPHQFQPVQGTALSNFTGRLCTTLNLDRPPGDKDTDAAIGATVWLSIKNVVVLTENYRQQACPVLQGMLQRMRAGGLSAADCSVLQQRVISAASRIPLDQLEQTQFIVQRNTLRLQLNEELDARACTTLRKRGVVVYSEDSIPSTGAEPAPQLQAWIDEHGNPAQVENLPRRVLYYVGQHVRFTKNVCPEYGVANGSLGEITAIFTSPPEDEAAATVQLEGAHLRATALPALIHVKVSTLEVELQPNMGIGVIPIKPVCATGKLSVRPTNSDSSVRVRYTRKAFPLIPTRCITDYKAQGSGFDRVVVDLAYPPGGRPDFGLAVYVMLSRAKTMAALHVLRPFDAQKLQTPFPQYVRAEWNRLCGLSDSFMMSRSRI